MALVVTFGFQAPSTRHFVKLLIGKDAITAHVMQEPFAELLTVQRTQSLIASGLRDPEKIRDHARRIYDEPAGEKEPPSRVALPNFQTVEALLDGMN